jgi:hypothetical protein
LAAGSVANCGERASKGGTRRSRPRQLPKISPFLQRVVSSRRRSSTIAFGAGRARVRFDQPNYLRMRGLNAAGERGAVKIDIKFDLKLDRIKNQHLLLSGVARACTRQCLAVGVFIGRPRPPWYRGTAAICSHGAVGTRRPPLPIARRPTPVTDRICRSSCSRTNVAISCSARLINATRVQGFPRTRSE